MNFLEELKQQRWDDHRYYHHSRVNQSLHLISAISFLSSYWLMTVNTTAAALIGWLFAMWSRQIGHFFFEPKGYDEINGATHEHKEAIKVGYNLHRKVVLLAIWAAAPFVLWYHPRLFGLFEPHDSFAAYVDKLAALWIGLGVAALLFRTVQLFFQRGVQTGLVWCTKILTDPFHDIKLYRKAPVCLLKGERMDPMIQNP